MSFVQLCLLLLILVIMDDDLQENIDVLVNDCNLIVLISRVIQEDILIFACKCKKPE